MLEIKFTATDLSGLATQMERFLEQVNQPAAKPAADPVAPAPEPLPEPKAAEPVASPVAVAPEPTAPELAASEITYADVKHAVLSVSIKHGREGVFDLLTRFGASKSAQEIDPSRWGDLLAEATALAKG